jgi:hypothetical protein
MVPFGRTAAIFDVDDSLLDGNAGTTRSSTATPARSSPGTSTARRS